MKRKTPYEITESFLKKSGPTLVESINREDLRKYCERLSKEIKNLIYVYEGSIDEFSPSKNLPGLYTFGSEEFEKAYLLDFNDDEIIDSDSNSIGSINDENISKFFTALRDNEIELAPSITLPSKDDYTLLVCFNFLDYIKGSYKGQIITSSKDYVSAFYSSYGLELTLDKLKKDDYQPWL